MINFYLFLRGLLSNLAESGCTFFCSLKTNLLQKMSWPGREGWHALRRNEEMGTHPTCLPVIMVESVKIQSKLVIDSLTSHSSVLHPNYVHCHSLDQTGHKLRNEVSCWWLPWICSSPSSFVHRTSYLSHQPSQFAVCSARFSKRSGADLSIVTYEHGLL